MPSFPELRVQRQEYPKPRDSLKHLAISKSGCATCQKWISKSQGLWIWFSGQACALPAQDWIRSPKLWKMFWNTDCSICAFKYDSLPSVLGNLTMRYVCNWEVYPRWQRQLVLRMSQQMVTETMQKGRLFPWDSNQTSMEIQRSVTFSHV